LFETTPPTTNTLIHRMIQSKYGRLKHTLFKTNLLTRFTRGSITEYSCTADPGSMQKEQTFEKLKA
jgi:hypothetical protein